MLGFRLLGEKEFCKGLSLIVRSVPVGPYAIAFWRLLISVFVFWFLARFFGQKFLKNRKTVRYALTAGVFLAFDLALWHESIYAVGPGISTLLNSLQIFFLSAIGFFFFGERLGRLQAASLMSAVVGVAMIAGAEFGYNGNAVWGFASGLVSGLMLALSMVFVRKTHEVEQVALFPSMMILSLGGVVSLVVPALLMDGGALYPTTWKDAGLVLVYGVVMQLLCVGDGCLCHSAAFPVADGAAAFVRTGCRLVHRLFWVGQTD